MEALRRYCPSHATVAAYLALFVALGGTSYAVATGSIDSREIKDNSVQSADVRNGTLTARDITRSTLGQLRGPQGPQGPRGAPGPQGAAGPAGLPATKLFAKVTGFGDLQYGSSATSASRRPSGTYSVTFNRDLSGCVALAQAGFGHPQASDVGYVNAKTFTDIEGKDVTVEISGEDGRRAQSGFQLAVFC